MRTFAVPAVLLAVVPVAVALGEKPAMLPDVGPRPIAANGAADPAVKKLIDDLADDDWRAREKAGRELESLGEKALPQMKAALLATDSPEAKQRLSVLVRKMDRARLTEPKRVTFSAKGKTAQQAYQEITKQTGYRVDFSDGADRNAPKLDLEFEGTSFWQALDAVANAAGHTVNPDSGDDTIRMYASDQLSPYLAHSGAFRFVATNINSNRNVQLNGISKRGDGQRMQEYMNLNFMVQSEPKNPMLGTTQVELTEAKDDLGGSLLPPKDQNGYRSGYSNGGFRGHSTYASVNLVRGDRGATSIKSLKGRMGVVLLSGTVPEVTVADPLKVKKKDFVGRTTQLIVESVDEDANQKGAYVLSLSAKTLAEVDPNRGIDYGWSNSLWQRLELLDAQGNRYFTYGPNTSDNNGLSIRMTMQFSPTDPRTGKQAKLGPPAKLVLQEWLTVTHEVTFAFKDVPLP
jgi:hypothetical protein